MSRYQKGSTVDVKARLLERHLKDGSGCWLWAGEVRKSGYGVMSIHRKQVGVHRASYEAFIGPVPEGMFVCHTCDVKTCINPEHLWVGSQQDNMNDKVNKGRQTKGEGHGMHKLEEPQVVEIKTMLSKGVSQLDVAKMFSVHKSTISLIARGKRWGWV